MDNSQREIILRELALGTDVELLLEIEGLSAAEVASDLTTAGRARRRAIRLLTRIQVELMAQRGSITAVNRLNAIINSDAKAEFKLRTAVELLKRARLYPESSRRSPGLKTDSHQPEPIAPAEEVRAHKALELAVEILDLQHQQDFAPDPQ